jgi:hypothetical protein
MTRITWRGPENSTALNSLQLLAGQFKEKLSLLATHGGSAFEKVFDRTAVLQLVEEHPRTGTRVPVRHGAPLIRSESIQTTRLSLDFCSGVMSPSHAKAGLGAMVGCGNETRPAAACPS